MHRVIPCLCALALGVAPVASAQERPKARDGAEVLVAAAGTGDGTMIAIAPMPSHGVSDIASGAAPSATQGILLNALPPPPKTVVLETKTYGTVTLDHAGHLARRVACKACHGPGPVHKIGHFTPKYAHDACRGCHQEVAKGPTDCRGCHVKPAPETELAKLEPEAAGSKTASLPAGKTAAAAEGAATAGAVAVGEPGAAPTDDPTAVAAESVGPSIVYRRTALLGTSILAGGGEGPFPGISAAVKLQGGGYVFSNTLDLGGQGRMLGLLGAGVVLPVTGRWAAHVQGVGGFDAFSASLLPALGGRVGFEWVGNRVWIQSVDISLTTVADIGHGQTSTGERSGGVVGSLAFSAGFDLRSSGR